MSVTANIKSVPKISAKLKDVVLLGSNQEGYNTVAGSNAFKIAAVSDEKEDGTGTYTLNTVEGLEVGMQCYAHLKNAGQKISTITAINGYDVTVDNYEFIPLSDEQDNPQEFWYTNYLIIVGFPLLGDIPVGHNAHAEGEYTMVQSVAGHGEGRDTKVIGKYGHSEGSGTIAGYAAHAEGRDTEAIAVEGHAEGFKTKARALSSHAENRNTIADGVGSHVQGFNTIAGSDFQHVGGTWNIADYNNIYAEIIGNGKDGYNRLNARTLDWKGNAWYAGEVRVGKDNKRLITEDELEELKKDVFYQSWAGVQRAVRQGLAPLIFPIGTQLTVHHNEYGDMLYDVVAHDYLKSNENENAHTMTLLCHDLIGQWNYEFDAAEISYSVTRDLSGVCLISKPVGETVNFPYNKGYEFNLNKTVEIGGQIVLNYENGTLISATTYDSKGEALETVTVTGFSDTLGSYSGHKLGFLTDFNNPDRYKYGSNNYNESGIRQFLNSSETAGNWWTAQTKFDMPPSYATTRNGFCYGLDPEFLSVVGEVIVPCSANNVYENNLAVGEAYTITDKFYLPSLIEITGSTAGSSVKDNSELLPYYQEANDVDRIKYSNGVATWWLLRTPHGANSCTVKNIATDGKSYSSYANAGRAFAPMCTIV